MPKLGLVLLIGVFALTLLSGVAPVVVALMPDLAASPHAATLISMFSDTWKIGVGALIGAAGKFGTR